MRKITDKELDEIRSYVVSFNLTDASDITGYEIDGEILAVLQDKVPLMHVESDYSCAFINATNCAFVDPM